MVQLRSNPEQNPVDKWHHTKTFFRPSAFPCPHGQPQSLPTSHTCHPLHWGCSCSCCSWKCFLQLNNSLCILLQWPKGTYPEEEVQSLGAVAEGHKEGAVCGKDPYPAGGTAHCHLACPPPTGLADQHRDRRKRELPTEQRDTASPARCGDRQHLARMRHLGQEEDKVLDLAGAWWLAKGRGQSCALGCLQMTVLHLSGKVSSQPPLWP